MNSNPVPSVRLGWTRVASVDAASTGTVSEQKPVVSDRLESHRHFQATLKRMPLFRNSTKEWVLAQGLHVLDVIFQRRNRTVPSRVVSKLTLWERFLAHRCRRSRKMTFAVAFQGGAIAPVDYIPGALTRLLKFLIESDRKWDNQPLNIVVDKHCSLRVVDPRRSTGSLVKVAIVDGKGRSRQCQFDLQVAAEYAEVDLREYVDRQLAACEPVQGEVGIVFNELPAHPIRLEGTYTEFDGAWMRVAPDQRTGGLVATADHLVLDGSMFQELLLNMACAGATAPSTHAEEDGDEILEHVHDPVVSLRVDRMSSLTSLLTKITGTLQEFGIRVLEGQDTVVLVTIPQAGPELKPEIEKHRRRVLPLIVDLAGITSAGEMKQRIQDLNRQGWCSLGAHLWHRLYCGHVSTWLLKYLESIAPYFPFQRTCRYLAGGAMISCLPPVRDPGPCASKVTHLSARTLGPSWGGPAITVMQVPRSDGQAPTAFITIAGTGHWNRLQKLNKFRDSLAQRIQQSRDVDQAMPSEEMPRRRAAG